MGKLCIVDPGVAERLITAIYSLQFIMLFCWYNNVLKVDFYSPAV